jgi:hypothetical protein
MTSALSADVLSLFDPWRVVAGLIPGLAGILVTRMVREPPGFFLSDAKKYFRKCSKVLGY